MGVYLNPGKKGFFEAKNDKIYVDKSNIIRYTNEVLYTDNKYLCVTRPRRFGKSTDAHMLVAYYDSSCDSMNLFQDLKIVQCDTFEIHLNQHRVLFWDVQSVLSEAKQIDDMIELLNKSMIFELLKEFPHVDYFDKSSITRVLNDIFML